MKENSLLRNNVDTGHGKMEKDFSLFGDCGHVSVPVPQILEKWGSPKQKFYRALAQVTMFLALCLPLCPMAQAQNMEYTVDPNAASPPPPNTYTSLEELRGADAVPILQSGDTIKIHVDADNTLAGGFKTSENSGTYTILGHGELGPSTEGVLFLILDGDTQTLKIIADDNKTLNFTGFARPNERGGVLSNPTHDSRIELGGATSTGTLKFSNNTSDYGGAIFGLDLIEILGGTNIFSENKATVALPDDAEDGYGGAIFGETVTIFGGENTFHNNSAVADGGAIHGHAITISSGSNTFTDNIASNTGGALSGDTVTISAGNNIFSGNKVNNNGEYGSGGAIYGVGDITLSGGTNHFTDNIASFGGAIYSYEGQVMLSDSDNSFENNEAVYGGAIYNNEGQTTFSSGTNNFTGNKAYSGGAIAGFGEVALSGGENTFTDNSADNDGGAIYGATVTISSGENTFTDNSATNDGGAIYGATVTISGGENAFEGNSADNLGGAIYSYYSVSLTADKGDILFQGNKAGGQANAIFLENFENINTFTLAASSDKSILFYDPVESDGNAPNLTININKAVSDGSGGDTTYTGTVVFDTYQSAIHGNTTVYNGRMELNNAAIYGAAKDVGSFRLEEKATLAVSGGGTIQTNTINLEKGSILSFDLASYTDEVSGALILNSGTSLSLMDSEDKSLNFAVQFEGWKRGSFTLVSTGQEGVFTGFTAQSPPDIIQPNDRFALIFSTANNDSDLVLDLSFSNALLTWTGETSDVWDFDSENFTGKIRETPISQFVSGDALIFDASGQTRDITLSRAMDVASLKINGGSYSFTGFGISSTADTTLEDPNLASQKMIVTGSGTRAVFHNSSLDFSGGIFVQEGATLGGVTTISGGLHVAGGAAISPGNSIGTLTVDSVTFAPGSFFDVEVSPAGEKSDLLHVRGTATLAGTVRHTGLDGSYNPIGEWTILQANNTITTKFNGVQSDYVFIDASLAYEANKVKLQLRRNDVSFEEEGTTPNEKETGGGIESQGPGNPPYDYVLSQSDTEDVGRIFDLFSGEMHAGLLCEVAKQDRAFAGRQKRRLSGNVSSMEVSAGAFGKKADFWFSLDGYKNTVDRTFNTSKVEFKSWGASLGLEKEVYEWRLGAAFRYGDSEYKVKDLHSKADLDSFNFGFYAGRPVGDFNVKLGAGYGFHQVDSRRHIFFMGENLEADYDIHSFQFFGEVGSLKDFGSFSLEPYAGLGWNYEASQSFKEKGGPSALRAKSASHDNVTTNLGVRAHYKPAEKMRFNADLNWQHLFGDKEYKAHFAFTGGRFFSIEGAPLDRDRLGIALDMDVTIRENLSIRAGYLGRFGANTISNAGFVNLEFAF